MLFLRNKMSQFKNYLSLIKFSHTIFAMPFAMIGFFLGIATNESSFDWFLLLLIIICMIFARSAAMAFNRYVDRDIDGSNPRTANVREIPNSSKNLDIKLGNKINIGWNSQDARALDPK